MNKEKKLMERSYHIPLSMFDHAFRCFQKKYVFPANIIVSIIFLVLAADFIYAAVKDNTNTTAYLLIVLCISMVLIRWYRTFKLRRSVHEALKDVEGDLYDLTVYEDGVVIRTEDAKKPENDEQEEKADNPPDEKEETEAGNGFQQLFPEAPPEDEEKPAPTEITFGTGVKLLEYPEFFMIYLVRANFYVIPKKDFSEEEIRQLSELFAKYR
ncbi:MAG: YcxB family protein [Oscillospiraceae bacterium]|nr:YcxB family protein [Oscillospiraceae bacterium]